MVRLAALAMTVAIVVIMFVGAPISTSTGSVWLRGMLDSGARDCAST